MLQNSTFAGAFFGLALFSCSAMAELELTAEEQAWIKQNPNIRIGVDPNFAPYEFIDEQGIYRGIGADYLALLSSKTGLIFEVVPDLTWKQAIALSAEKKIDLHPMLTNTTSRRKNLLFTKEYIKDPYVIITRNDSNIKDESSLLGKDVALIKGYSATELTLEHLSGINPFYVETELEALLLVIENKVAATIGHLGSLAHLMDEYSLANLKIITITRFSTNGMGIGVRNDWPILRDILDKVLYDISEVEKNAILRRWIMIQVESPINYNLVWKSLIAFLILTAAIIFWITALRHKVNQRTMQYKQELIKRKKNEERFKNIVDSTDGIVWEADAKNFVFTYVSAKAVDLTGYSLDEWKQPGFWAEHIYSEDREVTENYCVESTKKSEAHDFEYRFVCKNKDVIWLRDIVSVINEDGQAKWLRGIMIDITNQKQTEEQLTYQASHDSLTGLVNRREFEKRMQRLLDNSRQTNSEHALCYMDLDQFKVVNDTCGHIAGDEMLRQLSFVLLEKLRQRDTLSRLGGDEFAVLVEYCPLQNAIQVAETLRDAIQNHDFHWEDKKFNVGASMGLVSITCTTHSVTELLKNADAACYIAKDHGRNRIHVHDVEDQSLENQHGQMEWVSRIQQAIDQDRFCLYTQAIVPTDDSNTRRYEVLIRMIDNDGNIIPPGAFLPAAERYNLISQLDNWVIKTCFQYLVDNPEFSDQIDLLSINLSGQSLGKTELLDDIISELRTHARLSEKICFEITETATIYNMTAAKQFITRLKSFGVRFALDDFGTGLSSFAYLKYLPIDYLKIDGLFVKDIEHDDIDFAMVKSINEIGQVMGMQTIAEFVENDAIIHRLKILGVNYVQGYGVEKPKPIEDILNVNNDNHN